ncbi:hypothetical protein AN7796.2 [Aspergillus nidulans FGSC A4]|nr:hypothetical protein AN7796.2 [Aspergillus nidulans FGSC A4]|eukprot:XP_681065.1 hypothetical protein AN7796.2 [Aspergillus nidulans FGSC A4]
MSDDHEIGVKEEFSSDTPLLVSEKEALALARSRPGEALPLLITFGPSDSDNPRCWGFWRKWYITCFVSMLNVVTTWCAGGFSSGAPEIADLFGVSTEVTTLCLSITFGPPMALVVSGYIGLNLGFRWIFWILMAITGGFWALLTLTVPETRHSIILQRKARRVRKQMEQEGLRSASTTHDLHAPERKNLRQLFSAIYNGFLYGLVYLFNEAFPLVFGGPHGHGFNIGQQGLCFLGMAVGPLVAFALSPLQERYYLRRVAENKGRAVPEARMWMARGGSLLIPLSLFWFGWTSYSSVHWIVPIIASSFFGAGLYIVILSILNYVVDGYQTYSASALAGVILVRNIVGAGFPLFATQMYERLGYEWASSLLGFIAILLVPIPFVFFYKGEVIRLRSPWAREHFNSSEDSPH